MFRKSNAVILSIMALFILLLIPTTPSLAEVNGESDYKSPCCLGFTGNVDCSESEDPDITDITRLIDYLYLSRAPLCCPEETDINGSGGYPDTDPDISDVTQLIDFLYLSHTPLSDCPVTTVTDIDGNVYQTLMIGTQVWMAENLKVTHYRNGNPITNETNPYIWEDLTTGAYCNYNNDENNVAVYGRLYNWYAVVDFRNIAPAGWHVPTDEEWKQLEIYLGMSQTDADAYGGRGADEGGKLKETDTAHWSSPNTGATNESGFTALPGGFRYDAPGTYYNVGSTAQIWSSTAYNSISAWYRYLHFNSSLVSRYRSGKQSGLSVRCVKD